MITRRHLLAGAATGTVLIVAGCTGDAPTTPPGPLPPDSTETPRVDPNTHRVVTRTPSADTVIPAGPDGKANPDLPMPAGRAQCEVYLDGQLEGTAIFNTDFPACPQTRIQPGSGCYGFYKPRQICPLSGATGDPQPTCTCEAGGWQC